MKRPMFGDVKFRRKSSSLGPDNRQIKSGG